jgi:enolase-phosphatase E1
VTRYRAVLLDIDGTTTPVSFVYEVLFPYALAKLETFFGSPAHRGRDRDIALLREERRAESNPADLPAWAEETRKAGYRRGELRGEVYPEVE